MNRLVVLALCPRARARRARIPDAPDGQPTLRRRAVDGQSPRRSPRSTGSTSAPASRTSSRSSQSRELELADVDGPACLAMQNGPIAGSGARSRSATIPAAIIGYVLPVDDASSRSRPCSARRST